MSDPRTRPAVPHLSPSDLDGVLAVFLDASAQAGRIARDYFRPGGRTSARIDYKDGGSPVTEADFAVDTFLHERLCAALPDAAWLSEETADSPERLGYRHVLVVDPIDGTRGFLSGDARWTVCIALVTDGRPTVGVVYGPVLDQCFSAIEGEGARCNGQPITVSDKQELDQAAIAGPANLASQMTGPVVFRLVPKIPSLACRIAHVAGGFIDGCVAGADAQDWDIAAADLILHEAGGLFTDRHGSKSLYNRPNPRHPLMVGGPPPVHHGLLDVLRRSSD